jgi:GTP-binding protein Era
VAEFVREAVLRHCGQEVPHATAVVVRRFDDPREFPREGDESPREGGESSPGGGASARRPTIHIAVDIMVERDGQKAILIGRGGSMLKEIGADARRSIEAFLGSPVYLEIFVKVRKSWREDDRALDEVLS